MANDGRTVLACQKRHNNRVGGGRACFRRYRDGDDAVYDFVRGGKAPTPAGTLILESGNPSNLRSVNFAPATHWNLLCEKWDRPIA